MTNEAQFMGESQSGSPVSETRLAIPKDLRERSLAACGISPNDATDRAEILRQAIAVAQYELLHIARLLDAREYEESGLLHNLCSRLELVTDLADELEPPAGESSKMLKNGEPSERTLPEMLGEADLDLSAALTSILDVWGNVELSSSEREVELGHALRCARGAQRAIIAAQRAAAACQGGAQ